MAEKKISEYTNIAAESFQNEAQRKKGELKSKLTSDSRDRFRQPDLHTIGVCVSKRRAEGTENKREEIMA